jgi:hypothetical protein
MSSTSRARIGERVDRMVQELRDLLRRIAPFGTVIEIMEWTALIARRHKG